MSDDFGMLGVDLSETQIQQAVQTALAALGTDGRALPHGCDLDFVPQRVVFWRSLRRWNLIAVALHMREDGEELRMTAHAICFFRACPKCQEYRGKVHRELPPAVPHDQS